MCSWNDQMRIQLPKCLWRLPGLIACPRRCCLWRWGGLQPNVAELWSGSLGSSPSGLYQSCASLKRPDSLQSVHSSGCSHLGTGTCFLLAEARTSEAKLFTEGLAAKASW